LIPGNTLLLQVLQHRATTGPICIGPVRIGQHIADLLRQPELAHDRYAFAAATAYLYTTMKIVVEVKESKVEFLLELLRSLPFVKNTTVQDEKAAVLESVRTAVDQMKQVKAGKLKGRPVQKLLDEL